jgi:hypothetical protein
MKEKEFNNILDECLERILAKGETIEQCLASYPEQAAELKPLLETALITKKVSAIKPRPEFRERARYQLRLALQEMEQKRVRRFFLFGWQPRWATAIIIVLVLLLAGSGTVVAAGNSMPDEPLYPVKLAAETVRLTLTPSSLGKAELYAKLVDRRVAEIIKMAEKGKAEQVERTTQRLNAYLARMVSLAVPREERGITMAPPPAAKAPPAREIVPRERRLLERQAKIKMILARNAAKHPAALRAALKRVPESAKPALRRAIALSDAEYKKALKALQRRR